ncbi:hypothetical protein AUR64_07630 [Haloprofundus marisrubri]|uniref:DUF1616 domain-containing protein n=1 Tax=Haloprofundus marisrubri TaxID=1514971 RepID=A0A0W1RC31_9EURY|nr:DUF1616 domain-containing protein [Haloprofundus marisrubri]KTG11026.1 hypothetical protein AUR64_07630 [Haloprofundus marisrubri]
MSRENRDDAENNSNQPSRTARLRGWLVGVANSVSVTNVVLAAALVFSVGTVAYSVSTDAQGEQYTELYVLNASESGQPDASTYPDELVVGEPTRLLAGVENHEGTAQAYTLVVQLQRVDAGTDSESEPTVVESQRVARINRSLDSGEQWQIPHRVVPDERVSGERVRLTYLLYRGDAPQQPTVENAYRTTYIWVSVADE